MSNYRLDIGDEIAVSNTQTVRIVKQLAEGWTQDPGSEYIVQTRDNKIELYEVETIRDTTASNIGNRDIMVSDNASCWLWGSQDDGEVCSQHLTLLECADIDPYLWIDDIEGRGLRNYVAGCVFDALEFRAACEPDEDGDDGNTDGNGRYGIEIDGGGWGRTVYRIAPSAEDALRMVSDQHNVSNHSQLMYDAGTRGGMWATWRCTDAEGAMRGVRITAEIRAAFREITGVDPEEVAK